jgi:hypothetical protein
MVVNIDRLSEAVMRAGCCWMTSSYRCAEAHFTAGADKEYLFGLILHQNGDFRTYRRMHCEAAAPGTLAEIASSRRRAIPARIDLTNPKQSIAHCTVDAREWEIHIQDDPAVECSTFGFMAITDDLPCCAWLVKDERNA